MLTLITCPTCHHRFTVPEGSMGQRRTCPNCESIFFAGKSVAESTARVNGHGPRRGLLERAAEEQATAPAATLGAAKPPIDKTMLGEVAAAICYNCPRCKKPLESPASEAGTKKPCPSCGGRLQVPAASPAPAPAPDSHLNKTLLAESSVPQITPSRPSAAPTPAVAATAPPPQSAVAAALAGWRKYAIAGGVAAVVLLGFLYFVEKHNAELDAQREKWVTAQRELDQLKAEIATSTALLKQKQEFEEKQRAASEKLREEQEARRLALEKERDAEKRRSESLLNDEKAAAEARAKQKQKQDELDELARERERRLAAEKDTQAQLETLRKQLETANHRQTTIIQQAPPPPPVVYPWYYHHHPYYGW